MVNKLTIETAYKHDPYKSYYVILNPQIDTKAKKVSGLKIKHVEYKVKDWDQKVIRFEKVNLLKDKKFAPIIEFDKRYPDAENEVHVERASKKAPKTDDTDKKKKKKVLYDSYGIFIDTDMAHYNKLVRLHRLAEDMSGIYKALKKEKATAEEKAKEAPSCADGSCGTGVKPTDSGEDSKGNIVNAEAEKDIKDGLDGKKIDLSIEDVKSYFDAIQETEYFDQLETIQANDPSLATR